jgi:uncharacterized membrane protein YgaE (UPF0421/DUF939 family)
MPEEAPKIFLTNERLISLLLGVVASFLMAATGIIYTQEQATAQALNNHIIDAAVKANAYVRKDDMGEINARLQRIEDKLDKKADK